MSRHAGIDYPEMNICFVCPAPEISSSTPS